MRIVTINTFAMNKLFKDKMFWVKALFFVLAVLTGGAAMAVEIGENGSDTDPNDGKPLENATRTRRVRVLISRGRGLPDLRSLTPIWPRTR